MEVEAITLPGVGPLGVGDGYAEVSDSQRCTYVECARAQRTEGRSGARKPRPAQVAPATDRLALFMDTLGGGWAGPPGTRSHSGWGTLHATITTHDAHARTERAEGGGMARLGSWFGLKKKHFRSQSGAARGAPRRTSVGMGKEP